MGVWPNWQATAYLFLQERLEESEQGLGLIPSCSLALAPLCSAQTEAIPRGAGAHLSARHPDL